MLFLDATPVDCRLDSSTDLCGTAFVVCGHCLVTLSLTIDETLKWLSSLSILMQVILVVTV